MVEIIGLATMSVLVWLIAWSLAVESESEKRRIPMRPVVHPAVASGQMQAEYAA